MGRRELPDFTHILQDDNCIPLDDTRFLRILLPLVQVEFDSGPRTDGQLRDSWSRCSAALRSNKTRGRHTVLAEAFCRLMSLRQGVINAKINH